MQAATQWCRESRRTAGHQGDVLHCRETFQNARDQEQAWLEASAMLEAIQGQCPCQGRTPVPGSETPVWLHQGALSRSGQERCADADAVRTVEFVGGAAATAAADGVVVPAGREIPSYGANINRQVTGFCWWSVEAAQTLRILAYVQIVQTFRSPTESKSIQSRKGYKWGYFHNQHSIIINKNIWLYRLFGSDKRTTSPFLPVTCCAAASCSPARWLD